MSEIKPDLTKYEEVRQEYLNKKMTSNQVVEVPANLLLALVGAIRISNNNQLNLVKFSAEIIDGDDEGGEDDDNAVVTFDEILESIDNAAKILKAVELYVMREALKTSKSDGND